MSLKSLFVSCLAAVSTTACMTAPPKEDLANTLEKMETTTIIDSKKGCRSVPDPKNPDKPPLCINFDFPSQHMK